MLDDRHTWDSCGRIFSRRAYNLMESHNYQVHSATSCDLVYGTVEKKAYDKGAVELCLRKMLDKGTS